MVLLLCNTNNNHVIMCEQATKFGFGCLYFSETTSRDAQDARKSKHRNWVLAHENGKICLVQKSARSKCGYEFKINLIGMKGRELRGVGISHVQLMHGKGCKPSGRGTIEGCMDVQWTSIEASGLHSESSKAAHHCVQQMPSARMIWALLWITWVGMCQQFWCVKQLYQ